MNIPSIVAAGSIKHNILQEMPTKGIQTIKATNWLRDLLLPEIDRLEVDQCLAQWALIEAQKKQIDQRIASQQEQEAQAQMLATLPGASAYSSLALSCRIGDASRFDSPKSLSHFWGLTPRCRNSGASTDRLGSITKEGSKVARFILGQLVLHVLKKDRWMREWYRRIKLRRGSKIARVAVMRRLTVVIWNMLKHREPYQGFQNPVAVTDGNQVTHCAHPSEGFGTCGISAEAPKRSVRDGSPTRPLRPIPP